MRKFQWQGDTPSRSHASARSILFAYMNRWISKNGIGDSATCTLLLRGSIPITWNFQQMVGLLIDDSSAPFSLPLIPKYSRPRPAFHVSPLLSSEVNSR